MNPKPPFKPATPPAPWHQSTVAPVPSSNPLGLPPAAEVKARILAEYAMVFPGILAKVYGGMTVSRAVAELPIAIDYGAFNRWYRKDPRRKAMMEEAEKARAEVWADEMVRIASGESEDTLERDKFKVDVYKYLMGQQAKKRYGATKEVDVNHTISIAAALAESTKRVIEVDAEVVYDELPETELRMLVSGDDIDE